MKPGPTLYVLAIAEQPILRGPMSACYAAAYHLDLMSQLLTHDGTSIASLAPGVKVVEWRGAGAEPPLVTCDGQRLENGEPLPELEKLLALRKDAA